MSGMRKWKAGIVAGVVLMIVAAVVYFWQQQEVGPEYRTAMIEKGEVVATVAASGTLTPVVSVQVGSQVSGQLKEVLVDFNSEVKRGQVIARLDPQSFEHRVQQSQADVDAAQAQLAMQRAAIGVQRAQVAQAEVNLAEARRMLERKQELMNKGFISAAERDTAQAAYDAQREQVKAAQAQVSVAQASAGNAQAIVKQRQAALAQANVDLGRTVITAPLDGIVVKRSVEAGQTVAASLQAPELFIIAENLADMRVEVAVDEAEIGRIQPGQQASFTVDAFPGKRFDGQVKQIRKSAQTVSNVVTYMVEVSAQNADRILLPGMTANVRIVTEKRQDVLKVPNAALRFRPADAETSRPSMGGRQRGQGRGTQSGRIYLLDAQGQPAAREVELGLTDGLSTEIRSTDLSEGTEVVIGIGGAVEAARQRPPMRMF
jgi:HlyD family secretion protein